jgi:hypothetical protein
LTKLAKFFAGDGSRKIGFAGADSPVLIHKGKAGSQDTFLSCLQRTLFVREGVAFAPHFFRGAFLIGENDTQAHPTIQLISGKDAGGISRLRFAPGSIGVFQRSDWSDSHLGGRNRT